MIDELTVKNYALIAKASIEFAPGFTVLTGETGAGKTALVGAIKLLIGERADASAVTDGAEELQVSARLLAANGSQQSETIISRRLNQAGRSRASIDDEMVTVGALAERIGPLFDLLGQHEHQSLLSLSAQLAYLDRFAGSKLAQALQEYQAAWSSQQKAVADLAALELSARQSAQQIQEARFALESINAIKPQPDEYQELLDQLPILRRGEDLATTADAAWQLLRAENQALDQLAEATRLVSNLKGIDTRLDVLGDRLDSALIDLEDLALELVAYRDSVSFDAAALAEALDRLSQLEGLMRRFGPRIEDVLSLRDQANEQLQINENLPERLQAAEQALSSSEAELVKAAEQLGNLRSAAAQQLAERLTERLSDLAFSGASIHAELETLERGSWNANGAQRFQLMFCPEPRSQPRPLARIASGGELSRVMLALKAELLTDEGLTLVFDEVDAGIGGQAARAVADYLRRLANIHQVIVVTHLAQIAALADRQYVVEKQVGNDTQQTKIQEVTGEQRVIELARMLSGSSDAAAIAHARELLGV